MTYQEYLVVRAGIHWIDGNPIPSDLFCEMTNSGLDVDAEEKSFNLIHQYD